MSSSARRGQYSRSRLDPRRDVKQLDELQTVMVTARSSSTNHCSTPRCAWVARRNFARSPRRGGLRAPRAFCTLNELRFSPRPRLEFAGPRRGHSRRGRASSPAVIQEDRSPRRQDHAGVGVKQKELAYAARDAEIGGFEWLEGIPGNVGGALRRNAGAMGGETFRQVVSVRFIDPHGNFHMKTPAEWRPLPPLRTLEKNYAVSATFVGQPGKAEEIEKLLEASRKSAAPASGAIQRGCIFKNPEQCPAGKLVDELGLKGTRVGGAKVSRCMAISSSTTGARRRGRAGRDRQGQGSRASASAASSSRPKSRSWATRKDS